MKRLTAYEEPILRLLQGGPHSVAQIARALKRNESGLQRALQRLITEDRIRNVAMLSETGRKVRGFLPTTDGLKALDERAKWLLTAERRKQESRNAARKARALLKPAKPKPRAVVLGPSVVPARQRNRWPSVFHMAQGMAA